ncbi:type II toxin-antitoxin system PemK/MazF family toxin [Okibacterium endophyticum]
MEIDAERLSAVRMTYVPENDGNPDPGEIVWTWVPYEERDGRGKDRPVLIVAAERNGPALLAVQLTSQGHEGDLSVGSGSWDSERRESWVKTDRVFRVYPSGMRREAASLPRDRFERVTEVLAARYGWRSV